MPISFKEDLDAAEKCLSRLVQTSNHDFTIREVFCEELGIKTQAAKEFPNVAVANARLMDRKQQDYGSNNIAKTGLHGCAIRLSDKIERILNLMGISNGPKLFAGRRPRVKNEALVDSWRDASNYGIIALMVDLGRWPKD